ncbi:MAG TPA: SRPBCC family protein [Gemmatimonadaceae bacterium]|nr:SRPBCC family protein [Gemmatimonadaceae bacterium]
MTINRFEPSGVAEVSIRNDNTLVFTRDLEHPLERVWAALTDRKELKQWAPFNADRDLGEAGEATLTMADAGGATGDDVHAVVHRAEAPTLLEYTWGPDLLRWELVPIANGTRLTLHHTVEDRTWVSKIAAGWHICIDVMDHLLEGKPVGRVVSTDAMEHGWEKLNDLYGKQLGV